MNLLSLIQMFISRSRYLLQLCTDLHHFRLVITKKLQTESSFSNQGEDELIAESDNDSQDCSMYHLQILVLSVFLVNS